MTPSPTPKDRLTEQELLAVEQLRTHQKQLDRDGIMVGVSRQAVEETLAALDRITAETETPPVNSAIVTCPNCQQHVEFKFERPLRVSDSSPSSGVQAISEDTGITAGQSSGAAHAGRSPAPTPADGEREPKAMTEEEAERSLDAEMKRRLDANDLASTMQLYKAWQLRALKAEKELEALRSPPADTGTELAPIDMILHCPVCHEQHIDEPEEGDPDFTEDGRAFVARKGWDNPPHRSHLCHGCGSIWRPADVPTNGVREIKTKGKADALRTSPEGAQTVTNSDIFEVLSDNYRELRNGDFSSVAEDIMSLLRTRALPQIDRDAMRSDVGFILAALLDHAYTIPKAVDLIMAHLKDGGR